MHIEILWLDSVDSTNSEAKRRITELNSMSVIAARNQIAGRGQRTNKWFSERDKSLTFSIILKEPDLKAWEQSAISEATALAIVDALASYGIEAKIKWPNDIFCGDRKICGILIENSLMGEHIKCSIIGIGLNVNNTDFPTNLPNPTSMVLCSGCEYQIEDVLNDLSDRLMVYLSELYRSRLRFDNR